jgi:hypothetical protein
MQWHGPSLMTPPIDPPLNRPGRVLLCARSRNLMYDMVYVKKPAW